MSDMHREGQIDAGAKAAEPAILDQIQPSSPKRQPAW